MSGVCAFGFAFFLFHVSFVRGIIRGAVVDRSCQLVLILGLIFAQSLATDSFVREDLGLDVASESP